MTIFFVQANLVRTGNTQLHRKLGVAGFVVALGTVVSTLYVFWSVWRGWDAMAYYVKANRLLFVGFVTCIVLAIANRHRPEWHKRFIYVGTVYLLEPILSRAFDPFDSLLEGIPDKTIDLYWSNFFVISWNAFFIALLVYDRRRLGRLHRVSTMGYAVFLAVWVFVISY